MNKLLGFAAAALFAVGCSSSNNGTSTSTSTTTAVGATSGTSGSTTTGTGTSGSTGTTATTGSTGSTGPNILTGQLAFTVGKTIDIANFFPDGGQDPTFAGIDITDDSVDSCEDQEGYPDGGFPPMDSEDLFIQTLDPSGIKPNTAYPSLTLSQWQNLVADGGMPSGAFAQAVLYDGSKNYAAIGGTVTFVQDATTMEVDANVSLSLESIDLNSGAISGSSQTLAGNGTPPTMCAVGFLEQ